MGVGRFEDEGRQQKGHRREVSAEEESHQWISLSPSWQRARGWIFPVELSNCVLDALCPELLRAVSILDYVTLRKHF